ncbi:MAG: TIGR03084 family metal-binding protein [Acidimicrobiaceae bacterium]|nr:TIGR03084 family metal-binding protein [Acidimicrobiaceae bacterium]MCY4279547.1 TIGR03084 family metal-binding protein [Acidimicrobiaceae bacterium]MCY4293727.1 TIGR03084 family metal-binding protein [Acidimicrobiaceae bacterium]
MKVSEVLNDLLDEQASLDETVASLEDGDWDLPTASPCWSITEQIGHLAYFDAAASVAIRDPESFKESAGRLTAAAQSGGSAVDDFTLGGFRVMTPARRLEHWRHCRSVLAEAATILGERDRVVWYGPPMGAKSFLSARLMEAWAHGSDVRRAAGVEPAPTARLRHVAQLGCITRRWSYLNRGLTPPEGDVRVELLAPDGAVWCWGEAAAADGDTVTGPALDFCLVVTQRRNLSDTDLVVTGRRAREWMSIAQAFAGPPTDGPAAGRETGAAASRGGS